MKAVKVALKYHKSGSGCPQRVGVKSLRLGTGLPLYVVGAAQAGGYALLTGHEYRSTDEPATLQRVQARLELLQRKRPIYNGADHPALD